MKISIITLFPEIFPQILNHSILRRAQEKGLIEFQLINHRNFGIGSHQVVDDKPYGGGAGMVLKADVLVNAIENTKTGIEGELVILLDPQGEKFSQQKAEDLSTLNHLILVCGHYEGFDERVREFVDLELSIGDYVLTGGELPAMVIVDSVTRLLPGVLKDPTATQLETFSKINGKRILEGPQYTRPEVFRNIRVPKVYLSGNPQLIKESKTAEALTKTKKRRPDLID